MKCDGSEGEETEEHQIERSGSEVEVPGQNLMKCDGSDVKVPEEHLIERYGLEVEVPGKHMMKCDIALQSS